MSSGRSGCTSGSACPQILAAILTCADHRGRHHVPPDQAFVWPASAMLTGSGVALIFRVVGTPPDDPWNTYAWYVFAVVAGLSLLSKYVIRYRGSHVFNPSNIGLVVAFIVLGSTRVEPLDFWWAPLNVWMIAAYAVIIVGGLLITRRLKLLALAATFWVTLAIGVGILAGSGHCMTANWSFAPVCGFDFWRVIVTSPEVLIFLFFMITDPKTMPGGQVGRVVFGLLVGVASTLLMAPQTQRVRGQGRPARRPGRHLRSPAAPRPAAARTALGGGRYPPVRDPAGDGRRPGAGTARGAARVGLIGGAVLVTGAGIVVAGTPARGIVGARHGRGPGPRAARRRSGDASRDHGRTGCRGLRPHHGRGRRPGARPDAGREPRAREPGAPAGGRVDPRPPSTTATGSRRCRAGSGRDRDAGRRPSPATRSTP